MQKKTPDILEKILDYKIEYIDDKKRKISLEELKHRSDDSPQRRGFTNSLIKTLTVLMKLLFLWLEINVLAIW